jgi:hypothetical protein
MEILISEIEKNDQSAAGFNVTFINRNKKKSTTDTDFFPDGSEIEIKVQQLKKLLKDYFNSQP